MIQAALFPADDSGCGYYRMRLPADNAGVLTSIEKRARTRTRPNGHGGLDLLRVDVDEANVAVFQRPMDHRLLPVIEKLKLQGVAVVVEIDDDLTALDPAHVAYAALHPRHSQHVNWNWLRRACAAADLITVTTPALARRFAGHGRVVVLPNCVPARLLDVSVEQLFAVGWTGTVGTHPNDLDVLGDAIQRVVGEGLTFGVVGDGRQVPEKLGLADVTATGWLHDMGDYYERMASFGAGIVPLANSAFNHSKSALKGIEFAALGVPFVASPLPEYLSLAAQGAGVLATKPKRWVRQIEHALHNREELAASGRDVVRERYTIEAEGYRWAEAWERAIQTRQRAGRRGLVTA